MLTMLTPQGPDSYVTDTPQGPDSCVTDAPQGPDLVSNLRFLPSLHGEAAAPGAPGGLRASLLSRDGHAIQEHFDTVGGCQAGGSYAYIYLCL